MIYEYKCRNCHHTAVSRIRGDTLGPCPRCQDGHLTRLFSFSSTAPFLEHINASTQRPTSSMRQFKEDLKRKSEEVSNYTGMEHRFTPIDPTDTKALKVTEEGLDSTNRQRVAKGLPPVKLPKG